MADAHGSGPCVGNNMRVQVPSPALDLSSAIEAVCTYILNAEVSELADEQD